MDGAALRKSLEAASAGGCVTFEGWVRNENEGRDVRQLEYEGYAAVASKEGQKVLDEALEKFDVLRAECVHRVGHLEVGDMAVWIGVSAGHRAAAFDACRYIIEEIKSRLPIWKKETYTDGDSGWLNIDKLSKVGARRS
ncbi:MAG: molybdenum cofactor biosynthesis protein MoaE [Candidatus Hydrogenedentes bacterium]|nr:molybdenum cofactor biosynthesis protein MoaE [Candidatus Hydrogenedentota bacterium]